MTTIQRNTGAGAATWSGVKPESQPKDAEQIKEPISTPSRGSPVSSQPATERRAERALGERLLETELQTGAFQVPQFKENQFTSPFLLAPPRDGWPSFEKSREDLQQIFRDFLGTVDPSFQNEISKAIDGFIESARTAQPMPIYGMNPQSEMSSLSPQGALAIFSGYLREVAQVSQQAPVEVKGAGLRAQDMMIGADPQKLALGRDTLLKFAQSLIGILSGQTAPEDIKQMFPGAINSLDLSGAGIPQELINAILVRPQQPSQPGLTPVTKSPDQHPTSESAQAKGGYWLNVMSAAARGDTAGLASAAAKMQTPQGQMETRLNAVKSDDDIKKAATDPKLMAAATPEQKAKWIKQLEDGYQSDSDDEGIYNILKSAGSREEFDKIMELAGGKNQKGVVDGMDHDATKKRMNQLASAWGRMDLVTDPKAAESTKNALLNADPALSQMSDPATVDPNFRKQTDYDADVSTRFQTSMENRVKERAYDCTDPATRNELILENADRKSSGKEPLDLTQLTADMEKIRENTALSKDDREKQIEELRKKYALDEDTMRALATRRLGNIYSESGAEAGALGKQALEQMQQQYVQAVQFYGPNSPQALKLKDDIEKLGKTVEPYAKHLSEVGEHLQELYKIPPDFWERCIGFFSSIADWFSPLLNWIPGVGTILYTGYQAYKVGSAIANNDIGGMFKSMAGWAGGAGTSLLAGKTSLAGDALAEAYGGPASAVVYKAQAEGYAASGYKAITTGDPLAIASLAASSMGPLGGAVGGTVGQILSVAGQALQAGVGVGKGVDAIVHGDALDAILSFGSAAATGASLAGVDAKTLDIMNKTTKLAGYGVQFGKGIADGNADLILQGAGGLLGGVRDFGGSTFDPKNPAGTALRVIQDGLGFASDFKNGNYGGMLGRLGDAFSSTGLSNLIKPIADNPVVQNVLDMTQRGLNVYNGINNDNYAKAFGELVDGVNYYGGKDLQNLLQNPGLSAALNYTQQGAQLFQNLRDGKYVDAFGVVSNNVGPLLGSQALTDSLNTVRSLAGAAQSALKGDFLGLQQYLSQGLGGLDPLLKSLGSGGLSQNLTAIANQANGILQNPGFREAYNLISNGTPFVRSLITGDFQGSLQQLRQIPQFAPLTSAIDNVAQIGQQAAASFTALASGNYLFGLSGLAAPGSPLAGQPAILQALPQIQQASVFFSSTAAGMWNPEGSTGLWNTLQSIGGIGDRIGQVTQMEKSVRDLISSANGDIDAAARSIWQSENVSPVSEMSFIH